MSQRVVCNSAVKHIIDNFSLFGFGNEENAILQSVKELVENGIDACKAAHSYTDPTPMRVAITISAPEANESYITLEVTDTGCGISDPGTVLKCFSTSKDSDSASSLLGTYATTGRFGVGLSTCLVYSLWNTDTPMRLITKCKEDWQAVVSNYSMDQAGNPVCLQNRNVERADFVSGTKIRLHLPLTDRREETLLRGALFICKLL